MPGSVIDSQILRRLHLYRVVIHHGLLNSDRDMIDNIPPYIIRDKGYPCLSWLLVPYRSHIRGNNLNALE